MPDPAAPAPTNYPNAPPPAASAPVAYPPQGYPGWQAGPPQSYRGPMLPAWLTFGGILVLVGGVLVLVGFIVALIGNASYATSTATNAAQSYFNSMAVFDALVGVGIFLAFLGWLFHQMSLHRHFGH